MIDLRFLSLFNPHRLFWIGGGNLIFPSRQESYKQYVEGFNNPPPIGRRKIQYFKPTKANNQPRLEISDFNY